MLRSTGSPRRRPDGPAGLRSGSASPPGRIALAAAAALAGLSLLGPAASVAAQDDPVELRSVRFELGSQEEGRDDRSAPTRYAVVSIDDAGQELGLRPITGTVGVALSAADAQSISADIDGQSIGAAAADYANSLADALASAHLQRFARFDSGSADRRVAVDVTFGRELTPGHYLLIQELGGDGSVEIEALGADGAPTGRSLTVAAPYRWDTGQRIDGVGQWATVVPTPGAGDAGSPVQGLRLRAARAEIKVVVLEPVPDSPLAGASAATPDPAADPTDPGLDPGDGGGDAPAESADDAAGETAGGGEPGDDQANGEATRAAAEPVLPRIDLATAVVPAASVGGAGCEAALAGASGSTTADPTAPSGQATFCFAVTNIGATPVSGVAISDPRAGLVDARLARASGPDVLGPGERAVFYHHTTPAPGVADATVRASARAVDGVSGDAVQETAVETPAPAVQETPGAIEAAGPPPIGGAAAEPAEPIDSVDPVEAPSAGAARTQPPAASAAPTPERVETAPATLAMTGVPTEPWLLVGLATGLIFFGYTAVAAYRRPGAHQAEVDQSSGHRQLDALGFD